MLSCIRAIHGAALKNLVCHVCCVRSSILHYKPLKETYNLYGPTPNENFLVRR